MDFEKIDWGDFIEKKKKEPGIFISVLSDPHLYLCLILLVMMVMMMMVSCSSVGSAPPPTLERVERNSRL
jgi:hypothetical protein